MPKDLIKDSTEGSFTREEGLVILRRSSKKELLDFESMEPILLGIAIGASNEVHLLTGDLWCKAGERDLAVDVLLSSPGTSDRVLFL